MIRVRRRSAIFLFAGIVRVSAAFRFRDTASARRHLLYRAGHLVVVKIAVFHLCKADAVGGATCPSRSLRLIAGNTSASSALQFDPLSVIARVSALNLLAGSYDLLLSGTAGVRLGVRVNVEISRSHVSSTRKRDTLIYGAGDAGITLLREIR